MCEEYLFVKLMEAYDWTECMYNLCKGARILGKGTGKEVSIEFGM